MPITTARIIIIGNAPRVRIYAPSAPGWVSIASDGSSLFIGNNTLTLETGFKMGQATITLKVNAGDEIWAMSTSNTVVHVIGQPD